MDQNRTVVVLTRPPVIEVVGEMAIDWEGVRGLARWVKDRRPDCLPDDYDPDLDEDTRNNFCESNGVPPESVLFPHRMYRDPDRDPSEENTLTDNELIVEMAGRGCYQSWGLKAGRRSNADYIANTQQGEIPHRSIGYHAKMTFLFAGISRRVSHELIRNYVGADRNEEGAPSQESTRYAEHTGRYVAHPRDLDDPAELELFEHACRVNYATYLAYVSRQNAAVDLAFRNEGVELVGHRRTLARKRVLEAASQRLMHAVETSFFWTTNPMALTKLLIERDNEAADLEFQRFARLLKLVCVTRWPNLFPRFVREWSNLRLDLAGGRELAVAPWPLPPEHAPK